MAHDKKRHVRIHSVLFVFVQHRLYLFNIVHQRSILTMFAQYQRKCVTYCTTQTILNKYERYQINTNILNSLYVVLTASLN